MIQRISILTFALGDNYGAVLQAYALGEILKYKGYKVTYISLTWSTWKYRMLSIFTPTHRKFSQFRQKYLANFTKRCKDLKDLMILVKDPDDLYIVGSDQVWNPSITNKRSLYYFFNFLPDGVKRASYAASFGVDNWEQDNLKGEVKKLLKKFSIISVREESGINICKNTFGIKSVFKTLDPTLLLSDYKRLISPSRHKDKIVSFIFNPNKGCYDLLGKIKKRLGRQVLFMDLIRLRFNYHILKFDWSLYNSPEEWLSNIAAASYIVTDSFHCVVFSIIFKRQFIYLNTNPILGDRIKSLLEPLGLTERIYNSPTKVLDNDIWNTPINYEQVYLKLNDLRQYSMEILDIILNSISLQN